MAPETTGSTVPRRQLGRYLRELRSRERLTVKAAAEKLEWSEAKIWRIETGQTSLRSLDVEAMCKIYAAPADLTEALMGLAKETKARGWWHAYGDVIPEGFDVYIGLEESASQLAWYESELVAGTVADRGLRADPDPGRQPGCGRRRNQPPRPRPDGPPAAHPPGHRSPAPAGRPQRRHPAPAVGGPAIMSGQLARLAEVAELPNVSLRVVPFSAGLHPGLMSGPFVILRFPLNGDGRESEPATVYMDGFTGALYLDKAGEVERYVEAFGGIWDACLDEAASQDLTHHAAEELRT